METTQTCPHKTFASPQHWVLPIGIVPKTFTWSQLIVKPVRDSQEVSYTLLLLLQRESFHQLAISPLISSKNGQTTERHTKAAGICSSVVLKVSHSLKS